MKRFATREDMARRRARCAKLEQVFSRPIPFEWIVRYAPDGRVSRSLYHACDDPEIIVPMATRHASDRQLFRALAALFRDAARELKVPDVAAWLRWDWVHARTVAEIRATFSDAIKHSTDSGQGLLRQAYFVALAARDRKLREKTLGLVFELLNVVALSRIGPYVHTRFYAGSGAAKHRYMRIWRHYFPAPTIAQLGGPG